MHVAKGGISWIVFSIVFFLLLGLSFFLTRHNIQRIFLFLFILSGLFVILFLVFFRDPKRIIGTGIVAVADGIIRKKESVNDSDIGSAWFISTFMNLYHVHVNRMPIDGTIKKMTHIPGSHLPAFTKESDRNERLIILLDTKKGPVKIVLIAGTLARRIVPYVNEGDKIKKGERISLIRLGSRVDIYLSKKMNVTVKISEKKRVKAGVSVLATSNV
jgi:phosphatidylserine decarboxylase